jgi:phosphoglycerate dehydrogenase-like enzyme
MREYVFSMIFYFEKELPKWADQQRARMWKRAPLKLIYGNTMLIVGAGAIGGAVAQAARSFSLAVWGISRSGELKGPFDRMLKLDGLEDALPNADYVVACLPLMKETTGVFNSKAFQAMKPGAVFINVSRGELVEENALMNALSSNHLAGAAIDAFSTEPLAPDSPFWNLPNLLITPHVSGKFAGGQDEGVKIFLQNLELFLADGTLATEVFPERGY